MSTLSTIVGAEGIRHEVKVVELQGKLLTQRRLTPSQNGNSTRDQADSPVSVHIWN
jgi:hypothetical protein